MFGGRARCNPSPTSPRRHDSFNRLLNRLEPDPDSLWAEAEPTVERARGALVLDDSTLDKPFAKHIALVTHQVSLADGRGRALDEVAIPAAGLVLHLTGYSSSAYSGSMPQTATRNTGRPTL